jgi:hypothetical protein
LGWHVVRMGITNRGGKRGEGNLKGSKRFIQRHRGGEIRGGEGGWQRCAGGLGQKGEQPGSDWLAVGSMRIGPLHKQFKGVHPITMDIALGKLHGAESILLLNRLH